LDINVDKAADVIVHQKVLAEAKDPDRRPAFHARFLRVKLFLMLAWALLVVTNVASFLPKKTAAIFNS
jgi:hypothetical protein